jgi:Peptidase MA superfamily
VFKTATIKYLGLLTGLIVIFFLRATVVAQTQIWQNDDIAVVYEPPLKAAAGEVLRMYPVLRQELEGLFGWHLNAGAQVVLVKTNQTFQNLARNNLIVAFAVPDKNLIVIDYSRMSTRPFNLSITLKHEMCHLLLHEHINSGNLAKWVDEGVCQWASDGIGEILMDQNGSGLDAAIMAGQTLRLSRLAETFPGDTRSLTLAYEQSKSVVAFIDRQFGKQALLNILSDLKNGKTIETASMQNLSITISELENQWLTEIERTPRWLVYLADNLYGILFFLAALLTVCGFLLRLKRKRRWEDEQEEDDE